MKNTILKTVFLTTITSLLFSCTKEEIKANLPTLTTATISNISPNSASLDVTIANDGGADITAKGICWSTSNNPTISLSTKTNDGIGLQTFTGLLTNLTPGTTYYIRAYATNKAGTSYSVEISFTTLDITTGLVAYYPFNGNANDESGNNNNGNVLGGVTLTTDRNGISQKAYFFPGNSNSYIDCGNKSSLQVQKEITISAWFYMDGGSISPRLISYEKTNQKGFGIMSDGTSNNSRYIQAIFSDGLGNGSGFCCGTNVGILTTSLAWHHIVFIVNSAGQAKIFIDGILKQSKQGTSLQTGTLYGNTLNIGRLSQSAYDAWGGKIDDIRIYNRALSDDEAVYLNKN